jgi:hypothetical protein
MSGARSRTYRVVWSEEDQAYVGLRDGYSSLSWLAGTPEDALCGVRALVEEIDNEVFHCR